jgi:hypothetical protein
MFVQAFPSGDVCTWKAVAYAASHRRMTCVMVAVAPRSTRIHCGSLKALDQRVPVLPSTALAAGVPAFSVEEARTGLPWESSGSAARAVPDTATTKAASKAATTPAISEARSRTAAGGAGWGTELMSIS